MKHYSLSLIRFLVINNRSILRRLYTTSCLILTISLSGCYQPRPNLSLSDNTFPQNNYFEQLAKYGSDFATELEAEPESACNKYQQLHQKGDWRAGWVLALTIAQAKNKQCINTDDAIDVLTELESQQKINPDLIWLNQSYLQLLYKTKESDSIINKLNKTISTSRKQTSYLEEEKIDLEEENIDLEEEKEELSDKLEALKEIETNINQ